MIDPITIFAACKAAHAGIRECIDLYQDFKKDGKDVGDIVNDIGGHLGAFFTHQESFKEAEKQAKLQPPKNISINQEAMDRILRQQQLEQMETELREMIIYQVGMPGLWQKFTEMREIVRKEREKIERDQKKLLKWLPLNVGSSFKNGKLGLRLQLVCLHGYLYLPYSCMAFI